MMTEDGGGWHPAPSAGASADVHPQKSSELVFIMKGTNPQTTQLMRTVLKLYSLSAVMLLLVTSTEVGWWWGGNMCKCGTSSHVIYQNNKYMSIYVKKKQKKTKQTKKKTPLQYNCNTPFVIYCE